MEVHSFNEGGAERRHARVPPSIPAPKSRRHRSTSPTGQPGPYYSHHDSDSISTPRILNTALRPPCNYQQPRTSSAASREYHSVQFPILRHPVTTELKPTAPKSYTSSSAIHGLAPTPSTGHCVPRRHPRIRPAASITRHRRTFDVAWTSPTPATSHLRCPNLHFNAARSAQFNHS